MTIAHRFNTEIARLLPHMAKDPTLTAAGAIDEIVFRRSESLGGMACAILALIEHQE